MYVIEIVVYLFFLLPLWLSGWVSLFRGQRLRPIGIACLVPLVLFLFVGKSYYAVGTVPIVVAQGLMALSHVRRPRLRHGPFGRGRGGRGGANWSCSRGSPCRSHRPIACTPPAWTA